MHTVDRQFFGIFSFLTMNLKIRCIKLLFIVSGYYIIVKEVQYYNLVFLTIAIQGLNPLSGT